MPSERSEHHATRQALVDVYDYISPGTNEGISFLVSRLMRNEMPSLVPGLM